MPARTNRAKQCKACCKLSQLCDPQQLTLPLKTISLHRHVSCRLFCLFGNTRQYRPLTSSERQARTFRLRAPDSWHLCPSNFGRVFIQLHHTLCKHPSRLATPTIATNLFIHRRRNLMARNGATDGLARLITMVQVVY